MQAWRVHTTGEPKQAMRWEEVDEPQPGPGQLLVGVRAAAVNFPDALLCRGEYQIRPDPPFTPGVELCGEVLAHGADVAPTAPAVGSRVLGTPALPAGAYAEAALMDAAGALPAPETLDDAEAASLHIAYQTGWFALHRRARLQPGEWLLVHAAAGGVGSAAVQLGKAAGARVIGVVGGEAKVAQARELGCDVVIDRRADDLVAVVKEATGGHGADVVFDPVGGDAFTRSTKCIAFEGRIVVVGFASGAVPTPGLNHALVKNYTILGLHWGLYARKDPGSIGACHAELTRLASEGAISPLVSSRVPFAEAPEAVQSVFDGVTTGRVVVLPQQQ